MSRGIETIETVWPTGSSDTTIIVSVRNVFRPTPWSTPMISTFWRGAVGDGEGATDGLGSALGPADGRSKSYGSGSAGRPWSPV
jgi:hypothetical protein